MGRPRSDKDQRIVHAARARFLAEGVDGASLREIAKDAGTNVGMVFYYFPTKDDLLFAILDWLLGQVSRTLDDVVRAQESPRGRLVAELEVLFHSAEVNRKLYLVLFDYLRMGVRSGRFRSLLASFLESCRRRDMTIIEDGVKSQQFRRVNAESAAVTIRALVDGYCLQWLLDPDAAPLETYRDRCRAVLGAYLLR